jgi:hypothetical protein
MKYLFNLQKTCIVKIRANLERQKQYVENQREQCIIATSMVNQSPMWLFDMYLREK